MIKIVNDGDRIPEEELSALIDKAAAYVAEREGLSSFDCEVSLLFADEKEIKQLNAMYRGIDEPTDVLSFPMLDTKATGTGAPNEAGSRRLLEELYCEPPILSNTYTTQSLSRAPTNRREVSGPALLGDIAICREIAGKQAEEYGHSEEREIAFLFTHGLLHLIGYDHGEKMQTAEKEVLEKAGILR